MRHVHNEADHLYWQYKLLYNFMTRVIARLQTSMATSLLAGCLATIISAESDRPW
ncbi:uncharacterized protein BDV17DRAFT_274624 [Aspergillus undulatus]|uniref:uncharacterized protein n=1 Tax=Aspergillus undulatus TaxID=1810928 RepID=UPI003CCDFF17